MRREWVRPNTITGDAATKDRYLRRDHINDYFWAEVYKGNHILFVAPRRVGKTSIMKDLAENCPDNFACIYQDIEGVRSRNEFYQRLFNLIVQCIHRSKFKEAKAFIGDIFKKLSITGISKSGITIDRKDLDYEKELRDLIPELKMTRVHLVIFLDEFAEVIYKLSRNGNKEDALEILHFLREMRSDSDLRHFTLVFAGSIGLEFVIKSIDRPKVINDLHRIVAGPLTSAEASLLIRKLTKDATIRFSGKAMDHLKGKVGYLLPYYIQLMIEQIDLVARTAKKALVTAAMIDQAFEQIVKMRNLYFDDWLQRLRDYHSEYFPFINELLMHAAHNGKITLREVHDKAADPKFNRSEDYMEFLNQLQQDGYLVETGDREYGFVSPFLCKFWLNQFPEYE